MMERQQPFIRYELPLGAAGRERPPLITQSILPEEGQGPGRRTLPHEGEQGEQPPPPLTDALGEDGRRPPLPTGIVSEHGERLPKTPRKP
jgi:hypothetical protein